MRAGGRTSKVMRVLVVASIGCGGAMTPVAPVEAPSASASPSSSSASSSESSASASASDVSASSKKTVNVKMTENETHIAGPCDPKLVRRTIRASFANFRQCYEDLLKRDSSAHGNVAPTFVIGVDGSVSDVKIDDGFTTISDTKMQSCIVTAFGALSFARPAGKVWVRYPIEYSTEMVVESSTP
jgi:hypothetical protein